MNPATNRSTGTLVEFPRRARLHHTAPVQHSNPVGDREPLRLVVGDVEGRDTEGADDVDDLPSHLDALDGVEVAERLVERKTSGVCTSARPMPARPRSTRHGVVTDRPASFTDDFSVNLPDVSTDWRQAAEAFVSEGRDGSSGRSAALALPAAHP